MRTSLREHASTLLVAALASTFGVVLLQITGVLSVVVGTDPSTGGHGTVQLVLLILAFVFIVIAVYVGGVVTTNTIATIVAGRRRQIALLRLIGASARGERARIAREGLLTGSLGALIGILAGTGAAALIAWIGGRTGVMPSVDYSYLNPVVLIPAAGVALTTWLAAWAGAAPVLGVRPIEALGAGVEHSGTELAQRRGRTALAIVLIALGVGLLILGVGVGLVSVFGVLFGLLGGLLSFTGIVLLADRIIPPVLRFVGRAFMGTQATRLAAENAQRNPERASRMTIGLVIGVTLVTTLSVTMQSYQDILLKAARGAPNEYAGAETVLQTTTAIFSVLIGFSAIIAAVGLVNVLSLNVLQRTRELGLMRALGFDRGQLRVMVLAEAAALTITATVLGLLLGFAYGWVGAQSLLGGVAGSPGLVAPGIPWPAIVVVVLAAVVLTLVASVAPSRRATRVSPVAALAVE